MARRRGADFQVGSCGKAVRTDLELGATSIVLQGMMELSVLRTGGKV